MKVVLDTSALIYLNDFREFEEMLTVQEVIEEAKDRVTAMKLSYVDVKILDPAEWALKKVRQIARKTGDIGKLSKTDLKLVALARQYKATIISDDRNVQNVAERMQIPYVSVFNEKITKLITWKKYCSNCKKYFNSGRMCKFCGGRLKRVPVASKNVEG
jgi:UPF0271 protein